MRSEHPLSHCGNEVSLLCDNSISTKFIGGTVDVKLSNSEIRKRILWLIKFHIKVVLNQ